MREKESDLTTVWRQYQQGCDYLSQQNIYAQTDENYRMYEGDQWYGLESGDERLPIYNIIAPIIKYKVAMVAQNGMSIHYSSMNYQSTELHAQLTEICEMLNKYAAGTWERMKLDKSSWDVILNACVAGNDYLYFYQDGDELKMEQIDNTNIYFSNEQERDIQKQKYILIASRRFVSDIREQAKQNGIKKEDLDLIQPDDDTERQAGDSAKNEVKNDEGKCISILKMWKQDGCVHISRSVKNLIYQKDTRIDGMKLYPVAAMMWEQKKGSARSDGAVRFLIPNQLEINKGLARMALSVKKTAYPTLAVKVDAIENPAALDTVGATIEVNSQSVQDLDGIIKYIQPAQMGSAANNLMNDMISTTRDLAGAGDAVTGQINPEKASGAAIVAVRDAAALPLNAAVANYRQFVEDIALIWYDMWVAYHPNGMTVTVEDMPVQIPAEALQEMKIDVRVDVSATNPYSKYAQEQTLENLMTAQRITFEEYVEALDDDAAAPKGKLMDILQKRQAQQQSQMLQVQQIAERLAQENGTLKAQLGVPQQTGGGTIDRQSEVQGV